MNPNESWATLKAHETDHYLVVGDHKVMKRWEAPLMKRMAENLCSATGGGHILEVGYGMGISARSIQEQPIHKHTIIEPHPEIFEEASKWRKGISDKEINLVNGFWQENLNFMEACDGVFFDTYASSVERLIDENTKFIELATKLLKKGASIALFWIHPYIDERQQIALYKNFSQVTIEPVDVDYGDTSVAELKQHGFLLSILATK